MPFLLHINIGGNVVVGCLFVMVKLYAAWQIVPLEVAYSLLFFFFFFLRGKSFFGLSWHSSKNRCGWEVDILTYACLQTPTPYPHAQTHTHTLTNTHTLIQYIHTNCSTLPTTHATQTAVPHETENIPFHTFLLKFIVAEYHQAAFKGSWHPKKSQFLTQVRVKITLSCSPLQTVIENTHRIHTYMLSVVQEEAVVNQRLAGVNNLPYTHPFTHTAITLKCLCEGERQHRTGNPTPSYVFTWQGSKANRAAFACITTLLCGHSTAGPLLWLQSSIPRQLSQPTNYRIRWSNKAPPTPAPTALRILACVTVYLSVSLSEVQTAVDSGKKHEKIII